MKKTLTRITAALLVVCLLAGVADAGNRIGTRRALLTVAEEISYLVRATFTATDQGYSDDQVVDDPSEGIEDGQLTVVEDDGTLAIVSNKCAFTGQGTPGWGDLGFYSQAITRALGRGLLLAMSKDAGSQVQFGLFDAAGLVMDDRIYTFGFSSGNQIYAVVLDGAGSALEAPALVDFVASTDYHLGVMLGGYDSNAVPWRSGQAAASYLYGASWYIKGNVFSDWTLFWRTAQMNSATLYGVATAYDSMGTLDNFRVPDVDLSAVLQPTCLSTFTADDGTSLDAITPEVGGVWTEQTGNWDIQSNRAKPDRTGVATVETGVANVLLDCIVQVEQVSADDWGGIILRWADASNWWTVFIDEGSDTVTLGEYNANVWTVRATTAVTIDTGTDYDLRVIADGQTIDGFVDGGNKITYGSAALNETATKHGFRGDLDLQWDNFAVYPRTSSVYDAELDIP